MFPGADPFVRAAAGFGREEGAKALDAICDPDFLAELRAAGGPDPETLEEPVVGVWADLTIAYISPGWRRFGAANGGAGAFADESALGRSLLEGVPEVLRERFQSVYASLAGDGTGFYDYECSSADTFRRFRMTRHAVGTRGMLLIHHLLEERPHDPSERPIVRPEDVPLVPVDRPPTQCAYCRRMRVVGQPDRWVWVPEWVSSQPVLVSHGMCDLCMRKHFPDLVDEGG